MASFTAFRSSARARWLTVILVIILIPAAVALVKYKKFQHDSVLNYAITYPHPTEWKELHHSPQTLFLFQNSKTHLLLRGAVNQIISDINPSPDMQADQLADYYMARTAENMPDWTGAKIGRVKGPDTTFSLIKRERKGKCVVTGYAVKGNTTFMVTLSANEGELKDIEPAMNDFRGFVSQIRLTEKDMSGM